MPTSRISSLLVSLSVSAATTLGLALSPQTAFAVDVNAECAAMYGSSFTAVTGQVISVSPTSSRPTKGVPFKDPAFGTCVVRATNHAVEPPSGFARNDYARRQAFNIDNSRAIVYSLDGFWHLYDANTLQYLRVLKGMAGDAEPQWHPTDPNSLYWVPLNGGMVLNKLNVETSTNTVVANFTGKLPWADVARVWTKSEGSPSADGRYWCFMAETSAFAIRGVFIYDLQTQAVVGSRSLSTRPDHVSMSPSGRWCTISGGDTTGATLAWDRTFTKSVQLHHRSEHSDLAIGADGHDYYVAIDYQSNTGDMFMVDLDTGVKTVLFPTYINGSSTAYHVSGKAFARPGWVLLSTYAGSDRNGIGEQWLHKRIMAMELKPNPTIINLAHHHSIPNGYYTEPHASVSRDFSRVFFSSNWGTSDAKDVDAFMLRLPDNLFGAATTPPPTDTTAPTVTVSATGGSGNITLSATANDNAGVSRVDFLIDNVLRGSDSTSPYSVPFDSTTIGNGTHALVAKGYDAAGNVGTSASVNIAVNNFNLDPNDRYLWTVPPASNTDQQGFVRLLNLEARAGDVQVWGFDSTGRRSPGTVSLTLAPHEARQFNSQDLELGNVDKGLSGNIGAGVGNWTLVIRTDLNVEPLAYIRTPDGFLTSIHDSVVGDGVDWLVPIFNPAQNPQQLSRLRIINTNTQAVDVEIQGRDDSGILGIGTVTTSVAPLSSVELSSIDLESGNAAKGLIGRLGDGEGKWQLTVSATAQVTVQSLLFDPTGKLTNLSTVADLSQPAPGERVLWMVPPAANTQQQGFVRLINRDALAGEVLVWGIDDSGKRSPGTISLTLAPNESRQLNSQDLELGNTAKGLSGSLGKGNGNWRLMLQSDLNLWPLALIRTPDGFLTTVHDTVTSEGLFTRVPTFNPAQNPNQVSVLRLVNPNLTAVALTIEGVDDAGQLAPVGAVALTLPPESAIELSSIDLENGNTGKGLSGRLGDGEGKWTLQINATGPVTTMSLLRDPKGFLTNLSTATRSLNTTLQP